MKSKYLILISIIFICSCTEKISDYQAENFIKYFGSGEESKGNCVIVADEAESNYLLVGYDRIDGKNQIYVVKVNRFGNTIFEIAYQNDSIQEGTIVKKVEDGFIIIGTSQENATDPLNPKILKINNYGDKVWEKRVINNFDMVINDFCVKGDYICLVGEVKNAINSTKLYIATLDTSGRNYWDYTSPSEGYYKRVFLSSESSLIIFGYTTFQGYSPFQAQLVQPNPIPIFEVKTSNTRYVRDAMYYNGNSYFLINGQFNSSNDTLKLIKHNPDNSLSWSTDPLLDVEGKSMTFRSNGSLFVCGSNNSEMIFVEVDVNGIVYFGDSEFKRFSGTANCVISTPDKGLLIVGSTAEQFGTMVQLIKTDKDLYLLKP